MPFCYSIVCNYHNIEYHTFVRIANRLLLYLTFEVLHDTLGAPQGVRDV